MSSRHRSSPFRRVFLPGFIPGSLYVAILERKIQSSPASSSSTAPPPIPTTTTSTGSDSTTVTLKFLAFFYQEKPTVAPLVDEPCLQGRYWSLVPVDESGGFSLQKGSMPVRDALSHEDVLGYVRVAEAVNPRLLSPLIERDDYRIHSLQYMSSEIYIFNALDRLRNARAVNAVPWNLTTFKALMDQIRLQWETERLEAARVSTSSVAYRALKILKLPPHLIERPRPKQFTDLCICIFTTQEH